jgi:hypothetical protein
MKKIIILSIIILSCFVNNAQIRSINNAEQTCINWIQSVQNQNLAFLDLQSENNKT